MAKNKLDLMYKKEQEEEVKKKYGEKKTTPNVKIMMGKNEEKMKALTGDPNFGSTVKNALVKSATLQAQNQTMLAQNTTKNVMNVAQNYGAANASYGNAYNKYAQNVGETTKNTVDHWANANAANSGANLQMGKQLGSAAGQTTQKYGNIWGMTTGVTGSDQTGASIWGYRNAGDHKVNQGDYQQSVEKLRGQIADGGVDVLGHAIAARGLSGSKTLDSYNKFLEYSATGKISDDQTVTPGVYSKIVDEAVADYLTRQYGSKAGNLYNKATGTFDRIASFATLGPEISLIKGSMDLAGDTLNKRLGNGASDKEAAEAGFMRGTLNAAGEVGVNKIIERTNPIDISKPVKTVFGKMDSWDADKVADHFNDRKNDFIAGGIVSVGNSSIDTFEDEKRVFDDTVAGFRKQGLDQKQARRSAISELLRRGGSQALYDSVMSVAEKQFYDALQRRR